MQTQLQHVHVRQPQTFRYSLDWRFLLPMGDERDIYVLFEQDADFSQTLEQVGIPAANQLSFAEFRLNKKSNIPLLVMPFGLPVGQVGADNKEQADFYSACQRSMASDGHLLIGFNNTWYFRANTPLKYFSSTPRRITFQLKQAGFRSIKLFGAMPNLNIPEYIFDLESQAIYFALKYRFRRKPVLLNALHMLSKTIGIAPISNFLPCYFIVATV
jgi:hypothetical protein